MFINERFNFRMMTALVVYVYYSVNYMYALFHYAALMLQFDEYVQRSAQLLQATWEGCWEKYEVTEALLCVLVFF